MTVGNSVIDRCNFLAVFVKHLDGYIYTAVFFCELFYWLFVVFTSNHQTFWQSIKTNTCHRVHSLCHLVSLCYEQLISLSDYIHLADGDSKSFSTRAGIKPETWVLCTFYIITVKITPNNCKVFIKSFNHVFYHLFSAISLSYFWLNEKIK